jgi:hypothetical protein
MWEGAGEDIEVSWELTVATVGPAGFGQREWLV